MADHSDVKERLAEIIDSPHWRLVWFLGFEDVVKDLKFRIFDPKTDSLERDRCVYALNSLKEGFTKLYDASGRILPELLKGELGQIYD